MTKGLCAIQPCRALGASEREMRLKREKRGGEEKNAVTNNPQPGLGGCAASRRAHVLCAYGPLDKTSPPAIVGLRCAQPGVFADSPKHESCWQAPSSDTPGARSLIPASSRPMDCSSVLASGPPGRSPKPRCNPS